MEGNFQVCYRKMEGKFQTFYYTCGNGRQFSVFFILEIDGKFQICSYTEMEGSYKLVLLLVEMEGKFQTCSYTSESGRNFQAFYSGKGRKVCHDGLQNSFLIHM